MQQIPSKTADPSRFDYKHPIKRMFQTSFENGAIIQMDYSSLEMRILALAAGDDEMTQAFLDGADVHKDTAAMVNKVPLDKVTKQQRKNAKAVNFGIAYGESPFSFAPKHDMTVDEAEQIFTDYFKNKAKIKAFIDEVHEFVQRNGYVVTLAGHKRMLKTAWSKDRKMLNEALRQSVNTIIQGTGAYLTNMAVSYIDEFIQSKNLKTKLVMTVHDSIVLDCPRDEIALMADTCKFIMENLPIPFLTIDWKGEKLRYPIGADVEIGVNYNDMADYDAELFASFATTKGYAKYHKDMGTFSDYEESGLITEEQRDEGVKAVTSALDSYKKIA